MVFFFYAVVKWLGAAGRAGLKGEVGSGNGGGEGEEALRGKCGAGALVLEREGRTGGGWGGGAGFRGPRSLATLGRTEGAAD